MKTSKNNIIAKKNDDSFILGNTLTKAVVEVNSKALLDIENGNSEDLKFLSKNQFNSLVDMGFLIPKSLDENKFLSYILQRERLNQDVLVTFLMYSSSCNFGCAYCYESGQVTNKTMQNDTYHNLLKWYEYRFENASYKKCDIILYGGEPLLFINKFCDFLSSLKSIANHYSVEISTNIFTNGYLLDEIALRALLPYNLKEINVTLDGPPQTHNRLRPLKNNNSHGTFDVILKNILNASNNFPSVEINCRISFNKSNIEDIPLLLDILKEKDVAGNIKPYFAHITQTSSQAENKTSFCSLNVFSDETNLAYYYITLYKEALKRGFSIPSFHSLGPCMIFSENSFLISPDGDLFKCLDMVGVNNFSVGNIKQPMYYNTIYYDMLEAKKLRSCIKTDCPFIPICGSGCVIEPWLKFGDYKKIVCHRKMLSVINTELLLLNHS